MSYKLEIRTFQNILKQIHTLLGLHAVYYVRTYLFLTSASLGNSGKCKISWCLIAGNAVRSSGVVSSDFQRTQHAASHKKHETYKTLEKKKMLLSHMRRVPRNNWVIKPYPCIFALWYTYDKSLRARSRTFVLCKTYDDVWLLSSPSVSRSNLHAHLPGMMDSVST